MSTNELSLIKRHIAVIDSGFGNVMDSARDNKISLPLLYLCSTHFTEFLREVLEKEDPTNGPVLTEDIAAIAHSWLKTGVLTIFERSARDKKSDGQ